MLCFGVSGQSNVDSLQRIWNDIEQVDTNRLEALSILIHRNYMFSDKDSALYFTEVLLDEARQRGLKKYMAVAYNLKAGIVISTDYMEARAYLFQGLELAKEIDDRQYITKCKSNIGNTYYFQGDKASAFKYWSESLKLAEELGDERQLSIGNNLIGALYQDLGDHAHAETYYLQAVSSANKIEDVQHYTISLLNLAGTYVAMGDTVKAIEYYYKGLASAQDAGLQIQLARCHLDLARLNYKLDRLKFEEHLRIGEREARDANWTNGLVSVAEIKAFDSFEQKNYPRALHDCSIAMKLSEEHNMLQAQINACACLYEANKALNRNDQALFYHEKLLSLNDNLQSQELDIKLQHMEFEKRVVTDSLEQENENREIQLAHQTELNKKAKNRNIFIGVGILLVLLAGGLWNRLRFIRKSKKLLQKEKDLSENLLLNILPADVAEELKTKGHAAARDFENVSIIFTDFKEFTETSEKLSAAELVGELNYCFEGFDAVMEKYGVEKIKTIGDAYMAAGGLPVATPDSTKNTVMAALELQEFIAKRKEDQSESGQLAFDMRVGIHTGPVVAGIVGVKKFQYDLWGDTVNTASRMESFGEVGCVNISEHTYNQIKEDPAFICTSRGKIEVKGKGLMEMYFVRRE